MARIIAFRPRRRQTQVSLFLALGLGSLLAFAATLAVLQSNESDRHALSKAAPLVATRTSGDVLSAHFRLCYNGGGKNCVVDGDTFHFAGEKIRIADIDTPETHDPRCDEEAALGEAATDRLHVLLNAGPFTLESIDRDRDAYGRQLRRVTRNGESLGATLVDEGLARWYEGGRRPWC